MKRESKIVAIAACVVIAAVCFSLAACANNKRPGLDKLPEPKNLRLEDGCLVWDKVKNAVAYEVYYGDGVYETDAPRFDLSDLSDFDAVYELGVLAKADGVHYADSEKVEFSYSPKEMPTSGLTYKLLSDKSGYEVSCANKDIKGRVVIPPSYKGLPVKSIAAKGFQFVPMTEIYIPDSVTVLGNEAFFFCLNLEEIRFPQNIEYFGNNVLSIVPWRDNQPDGIIEISGYMIDYKGTLADGTEITLPSSVKKIAGGAFDSLGGKSLTLTVPDGVRIDAYAFHSFSGLKSVRLPSDIKKIPDNAFRACRALESVEIPDGVTEIGDCAFLSCSTLKELTLPSGLRKIGDNVFDFCNNLKVLKIPDSVVSIGALDSWGVGGLIMSKTLAASGLEFSTEKHQYIYVTCTPKECEYDFDLMYAGCLAVFYLYVENEEDLPSSGHYWHYDVDGVTPKLWALE